MTPSAKKRAYRRLEEISKFKACDSVHALPQLAGQKTPLSDAEQLLGAYENTLGVKEELILLTDRGLHWWSAQEWHSLKYSDITRIDWPSQAKMEATELPIRERSGRLMRLPVRGGTEFTRDLFGVWTFLLRMTEDDSPKTPKD